MSVRSAMLRAAAGVLALVVAAFCFASPSDAAPAPHRPATSHGVTHATSHHRHRHVHRAAHRHAAAAVVHRTARRAHGRTRPGHSRHGRGRAVGLTRHARAGFRSTAPVTRRIAAAPRTPTSRSRVVLTAAQPRATAGQHSAARPAAGHHPRAATKPAHRPATGRAAPPVDRTPSVVRPLQRLGDVIGKVPGLSVFGGPLGWLFTGALLTAVAMIASAFVLGHRRREA